MYIFSRKQGVMARRVCLIIKVLLPIFLHVGSRPGIVLVSRLIAERSFADL
jgi:hypothetical protein